ncbi:uncharacterized protein LOC117324019 [Pecten maximus]|uniref:uncharacterized protein LOC117324019 n=1 Tax=Pecten maximus TaxID=6579 RepID=UPI001458CA38|nr:uncharacterized protein LOC117324019 [Pecten maximus]
MMNLNKQPLFPEEEEILPDNNFECGSSPSHVAQHLRTSTDKFMLTGSTKSTRNSHTTLNGGQQKFAFNKQEMFRHFDDQGQNAKSESSDSERNDDSQPGPSSGQQNVQSEQVSTSVINTAKLLCKSGKINSDQLQQLLKYITQSRGITLHNSTSGRTDHSKLTSLISQLAQQSKDKQGVSGGAESQQVDLDSQQVHLRKHQVNLDGHQVQSSDQRIPSVGQSTPVQYEGTKKPGVTKDLCKTTSTVQSICHPVLCQTSESKNTSTDTVLNTDITSSRSHRPVIAKMLQGVDLQAFTPVDQALSLFEVAPSIQQDTAQFHPHSLSIVSESYCPSIHSVTVKAATTPPTQINVGHSPDNGIMDANDTTGWEYSGANLADLLIPDTSGSDAATEDNDCSTTFLASGDGNLMRTLKTGRTDELPGTSGISYRDNSLQRKTQNDVEASEFYCSPEKVLKLESSTSANSSVSGSFSEFVLPSLNSKSSNLKRKRYKKTADALQGSGLMDITVKTAELIQRNSKLQKEIDQLKKEAAQFYESVLQNPENREIREKLKRTEQQSTHL